MYPAGVQSATRIIKQHRANRAAHARLDLPKKIVQASSYR
jgi:hypothetical protein